MNTFQDLTGRRFGRLLVLSLHSQRADHKFLWSCMCDCGNTKTIRGDSLKRGTTNSCGCLLFRNGAKQNPLAHVSWTSMIKRCSDAGAGDPSYKWYGGRGIKVCDRWMEFKNFLEDMGERPKGMSLDRIDPNGHYEPGNCRWATWEEQSRNKRTTRLATIDGVTKCYADWAKESGLPRGMISSRAKHQWGDDALIAPSKSGRSRRLNCNNKTGMKGVKFDRGSLSVNIRSGGKGIYLGSFRDIQLAGHAYNKAAVAIQGQDAVLNPVGTDPRSE